MAKLVIVESPAKAKTIGKYLGDDYEVTASMGHIRDLPASQLGIDVEHGYTPQYISIKGKEKLIKELKSKAKHADGVLLATDPDREGEAISWHLANILGLDPHAPNRVTFDEITKKGVKEGMAHPRAIDEDLFNAQQARRVLDRLVGYKLSPFLWRKVRRGLSAGRVQSVAVRLIDDREKEHGQTFPLGQHSPGLSFPRVRFAKRPADRSFQYCPLLLPLSGSLLLVSGISLADRLQGCLRKPDMLHDLHAAGAVVGAGAAFHAGLRAIFRRPFPIAFSGILGDIIRHQVHRAVCHAFAAADTGIHRVLFPVKPIGQDEYRTGSLGDGHGGIPLCLSHHGAAGDDLLWFPFQTAAEIKNIVHCRTDRHKKILRCAHTVSVHGHDPANERHSLCERLKDRRARFRIEDHASHIGRQLSDRQLHTGQRINELSLVALRIFRFHHAHLDHGGIGAKLLQTAYGIELIVLDRDVRRVYAECL